jgi:hypothetical protein
VIDVYDLSHDFLIAGFDTLSKRKTWKIVMSGLRDLYLTYSIDIAYERLRQPNISQTNARTSWVLELDLEAFELLQALA